MNQNVVVCVRPGEPDAWALLSEVREGFPKLTLSAINNADGMTACPVEGVRLLGVGEPIPDADLLLCLGGDGTIIRGAAEATGAPIPILSVNLGRLGFLAEIPPSELLALLPKALQGALRFEDRMRLHARVEVDGAEVLERAVLNDVVVASGNLARLTSYRVSRDGRLLTEVRGDGVVVATPTGSTAYSMAAGGPIMQPGLEACVVTPICPHNLTHRPLVLGAEGEVVVELTGELPAFVTLDGQAGHALSPGDRIRITKAPVPVRVLQHPQTDHYETLRKKLLWGQG